jgi:hypothetical protein
LWLLNGGQIAVIALLAVTRQPLAAAVLGALLLAQIALQPALHGGADPHRVSRLSYPLLLAGTLVAALALP